jgi:hypothetical protein
MSEKKTIKRKSRKGVYITPHKGGRTSRRLVPMTPATEDTLNAVLKATGKSVGDWVEAHVRQDAKALGV